MFFVQPPLYGTNHGSPGIFPFFNPLAALAGFGLTDLYKQFRSNDPQQSMDPQSNPNSPENATLNSLAMTIGMNPALASVLGIGSVVIGLFKKFSEKADKKAEKTDPQAAEKFGLNAKNLDPEQLKQQLSVLEKEKEQLTTELRESQEDEIKAAELQRKIKELEENERKLREELEKARKLAEQRAKTWEKRMERWKKRAKRFQEKLVRKAEQPQKAPADLAVAAAEAREQYKTQTQAPRTEITAAAKRGVLGPDARSNFVATQGTSTGARTNTDFGQGYTVQQKTPNADASKTADAPAQAEQPNAFAEYAKQQMRKMEETLAKNQSPLQNLKPSRSMTA